MNEAHSDVNGKVFYWNFNALYLQRGNLHRHFHFKIPFKKYRLSLRFSEFVDGTVLRTFWRILDFKANVKSCKIIERFDFHYGEKM